MRKVVVASACQLPFDKEPANSKGRRPVSREIPELVYLGTHPLKSVRALATNDLVSSKQGSTILESL